MAKKNMDQEFELPISIQELSACGIGGNQLPIFLNEFRQLNQAGFAIEDIADAMYSDPRFSTAIERGDHAMALSLIATSMRGNLSTIERSRIEEDRLWELTEAGLAVGEIAWAIRNISGFKEDMLTVSSLEVEVHAKLIYEFFRKNRRTRRVTRTTRWGIEGDENIESEDLEESWYEHYSEIADSCGADTNDISRPMPTKSLFGKLADPDYSIYDEMIENKKIEKEQMEARTHVVNATTRNGIGDNRIQLIVFVFVIIGIAIILSLIGNR